MSGQAQRFWEIEVRTDTAGVPVTVMRNGRREEIIAVCERWRLADEWWGKEVEWDYFRIGTSAGVVLDIYRDSASVGWYLDKLHD